MLLLCTVDHPHRQLLRFRHFGSVANMLLYICRQPDQPFAELLTCSDKRLLCSCSAADRRLYLLLLRKSISISERAGAPHSAPPILSTFTLLLLCAQYFGSVQDFGGLSEGTLIKLVPMGSHPKTSPKIFNENTYAV